MLHGSVFLPLFLSLCPIYEDIYESQVCVFLSKIDTPVVSSVFFFDYFLVSFYFIYNLV